MTRPSNPPPTPSRSDGQFDVLFTHTRADLRHPLFSLTVHLYTCILLPLLHSLWLLTGSGNANFFYAATMVYGLNSTLAVADVLSASITYDMKQRLRPLLFTVSSSSSSSVDEVTEADKGAVDGTGTQSGSRNADGQALPERCERDELDLSIVQLATLD